jgi:uncharacterized membrane protein YdcZ (DUF606 family)
VVDVVVGALSVTIIACIVLASDRPAQRVPWWVAASGVVAAACLVLVPLALLFESALE